MAAEQARRRLNASGHTVWQDASSLGQTKLEGSWTLTLANKLFSSWLLGSLLLDISMFGDMFC